MNQAGIEKLYHSYSTDVRKLLFQGGKDEVEIILSSLSSLCDLDSQDLTFESMKCLCNIYVDTCIRKTARDEDVDIISDMLIKHKQFIKELKVACNTMSFFVLHSQDIKYKFDNNDETYIDLSQMYLDSFKFMKENEGKENKHLSDDDYGLVNNKPIYTHGQTGTELYFGALIGDNDQELIYEYETSLEVDGIKGFVDVYNIKEENNPTILTSIYINRYGNRNSKKAPKGFKLKKVDIENALEHSKHNIRKELKRSTIIEIITLLLVSAVIIWLLLNK